MYKNKVLVTGGAGFIASHITERLIRENYRVVVIDDLSSGKRKNLSSRVKFYRLDIRNRKISDIFKKERPKTVFHFAGSTEIRNSVKNLMNDARINIIGSLNILENCRKFNIKKIIFASSGGGIHGDVMKIPTQENYIPLPYTPYGVTKLAFENYLQAYYRLYKLPYISLRFSNVYGPRQDPNKETGVIAIFIKRMLNGKEILIYGNGKQIRDYIFIEDAVDASMLLYNKNVLGCYNIATGKEVSVLDIFIKLKKIINPRIKKKHSSSYILDHKKSCFSVAKIRKEFAWKPKYNLDNGLKKTVEWFKKN